MQEVNTQYKPRTYKESKAAKRHQLFVDTLLSDPNRNAAQSYMKVYPNCSYETARQNASQLLTKPYVNEQIAKREAEILEKLKRNTEITREKIIDYIIEDKIDAKRDKQHSVSMKGNELLAKMQGYLVDKQVNLNMSLEDLMEVMSKNSNNHAEHNDTQETKD